MEVIESLNALLLEEESKSRKLENRIEELESIVNEKTFDPYTRYLSDAMKVEYFIEHIEFITQEDLEVIVKADRYGKNS